MVDKSYTTTLLVNKSPEEVFNAINNIRGWWSEDVKGNSSKKNDEFEIRFEDIHYSKQKLTEFIKNKKIAWRVTDSRLNFLKNKKEWTGTTMVFDISRQGTKTKLRFRHVGLVPEFECYDACSKGWKFYIMSSLRDYLVSGKGEPQPLEPPGSGKASHRSGTSTGRAAASHSRA